MMRFSSVCEILSPSCPRSRGSGFLEDSSYKKPTPERSSLSARLSHDSNICSRNFTDGAGRGRYLPRKQREKGLAGLPVTLPTVSPGLCQRQEGASNDTINSTRV